MKIVRMRQPQKWTADSVPFRRRMEYNCEIRRRKDGGMITLRDLRELQETLVSILTQGVFLRQALRHFLRGRNFNQAERAWARDFLHRSIQLKNRYWTAAEAFIRQEPDRDDQPLDLRYFFLFHYFHQKTHSPVDEKVFGLLESKSRVRKFRHFLKETKPAEIFPKASAEDPVFLWRYHSHPLWMIRKWLAAYPYQDVIRFCQFNNSLPDVSLRVNPLKVSRDDFLAQLKEAGIHCKPSPHSPLGILAERGMDPLMHPGHRDGRFVLQNPSSQIVCFYVNPKPGERLLDFCAGEGGKTLLLAHLMKGKGEVHAHDRSHWRLQSLQQRLRSDGIGNVRLAGLRAIKKLAGTFDRVVLDVPCSGSGVFRHQPELKWKLEQKDLYELNKLQLEILEESSPLLRPGGLLFYITCSVFREENHKVIHRFLKTHPEWRLVPPPEFLDKHHAKGFWVPADTFRPFTGEEYFQILPHQHGLAGMFCAVLQR
jgi:16S rRNA (cytosine967-C5)-methyltransferase